jgi:hypothetical protein
MSKPNGPQFIRLYHYAGTLGEKGEKSVRERGLLPFRQLHPDFYWDEDEVHPDHNRVFGFDTPRGRGHIEDVVEFEVPANEAIKMDDTGAHYVERSITPQEIKKITRPKR